MKHHETALNKANSRNLHPREEYSQTQQQIPKKYIIDIFKYNIAANRINKQQQTFWKKTVCIF